MTLHDQISHNQAHRFGTRVVQLTQPDGSKDTAYTDYGYAILAALKEMLPNAVESLIALNHDDQIRKLTDSEIGELRRQIRILKEYDVRELNRRRKEIEKEEERLKQEAEEIDAKLLENL